MKKHHNEAYFLHFAKKNMKQFDLESFKKTHSSLFQAIMEALEEKDEAHDHLVDHLEEAGFYETNHGCEYCE